jgi:curli biogenesis system outer membrane secretion channel CsgG
MKSFRKFLTTLFVLFCVLTGNADGAEKIRIGVLEFESKTEGVSEQQAQSVTDIFTRTLANSRSVSIIERIALESIGKEQRLSHSGLMNEKTAIEVGKIAGCQYILLGSVTEFSQKNSGGGIFVPISFVLSAIQANSRKEDARVTLDVRVVDVTTSEVSLSLSESGLASRSSSNVMGFTHSGFDDLDARAIADAASRLGQKILEIMGQEYPHVISVEDSRCTIDIGATMGVKEGALYLAYADGKALLGMDGRPVGVEQVPLAVLKVRDVQNMYSVCTVTSGRMKLLRRGDKIQPITSSKAKSTKFATERPASLAMTNTPSPYRLPPVTYNPPPPAPPATPALAPPSSDPSPSLALDTKKVKWSERKNYLNGESKRAEAQVGHTYWVYWDASNLIPATKKYWELEVSIDRKLGGSGIMFGDVGKDRFMIVCLYDDKLMWHQYTRSKKNKYKTLSEAALRPEHQKLGKITMKVEIAHDKGAVDCSINGVKYTLRGTEEIDIPVVRSYGIFIDASGEKPALSVFRNLKARAGS